MAVRVFSWSIVLALAACGRIDFGVRGNDGGAGTNDGRDAANLTCSDAAPVARASVDSIANDWEPMLSPDNQLLVFTSDRSGTNHLYMATNGGFGAPTAIASLTDGAFNDYGPSWNGDGTRLYFGSSRPGASALFVSTYQGGGVFDAPTAETLAPSGAFIDGAAVSADELELFYSNNDTDSDSRLSFASRAAIGDPWNIAGVIPELDEGFGDGWPALSANGLTLMFETTRPNVGGTITRIYQTHRSAIGATWDEPTPVSDVDPPNMNDSNGDPDLSADGMSLLFSSTRAGGLGNNDIYVSTRTCL